LYSELGRNPILKELEPFQVVSSCFIKSGEKPFLRGSTKNKKKVVLNHTYEAYEHILNQCIVNKANLDGIKNYLKLQIESSQSNILYNKQTYSLFNEEKLINSI